MRTLRLIIVTRAGAVPVLLAASIVPACDPPSSVTTDKISTSEAGGQGGQAQGGQGGASGGQGGQTVILIGGSGGGKPPETICSHLSAYASELYTVPVPAEGVPAEPGQLCSISTEPIQSGQAARVTLTGPGDVPLLTEFDGFCAIVPALEPLVLAPPEIEVVDATHTALLGMTFLALTKKPGGYALKAVLPQPLLNDVGMRRLTVRITLRIVCASGERIVHATTDIHLCQGTGGTLGDSMWVSSGDLCTICQIIAEMAPSPIVPGSVDERLPLARVMRLRLVELARISGTVVLLAENDGGEGLDYRWHPSAGHMEILAPDIVQWTVAPGDEAAAMQVAVCGPSSAAVASFAFNLDSPQRKDATFAALSSQEGLPS